MNFEMRRSLVGWSLASLLLLGSLSSTALAAAANSNYLRTRAIQQQEQVSLHEWWR